ncbi:MAG TPA: [FeFe] hydrogenase H-cluster radical SAM maturase HydE [Clostridiales bacterium]|nr:[FeFe] hydrogenase H-cluster radical SAM maturase HydE [Clostridiales bacterium]
MKNLIDKLEKEHILTKSEFVTLLNNITPQLSQYLFKKSTVIAKKHFGNRVYVRGLIEFTNYCKNDCYYCGIRCSNKNADRYRLTMEEILGCCEQGYSLGFRTYVLQGGEDPYFTDDKMVDIITAIKERYPRCAITLSIGEKTKESYQKFFDAGADRFLLRHETADCNHYSKLHPNNLSAKNRQRCLFNLKEIGYQTGTGFMVGSPYQTVENLADDLLFIKQLSPQMVGIGPFIPHCDTPFRDKPKGNVDLCLFLLGLLRLMIPNVLLPATTALGTAHNTGREKGILAGANVVMPNLSPVMYRKKYSLYDNKICTGEEAAECNKCLARRMNSIGYEIVTDRGDYKPINIIEN